MKHIIPQKHANENMLKHGDEHHWNMAIKNR
jgi:hypothetical protein